MTSSMDGAAEETGGQFVQLANIHVLRADETDADDHIRSAQVKKDATSLLQVS